MARQYLEQIDPKQLRPNPRNKHVVGDVADLKELQPLIDSIKRLGYLESPIIVTSKYMIADGHRRHAAVLALGLDRVACFVTEEQTPEGAMRMWREQITSARQHTDEQKAKIAEEYQILIHGKLDAKPEHEPVQETFRSEPTGKSSDENIEETPKATMGRPKLAMTKQEIEAEAAKLSGVGGRTKLNQAKRVIAAIEKLEAAGDFPVAQGLRDTLNNKSVAAAVKLLDKMEGKPEKPKKPKAPKVNSDNAMSDSNAPLEDPSTPEPPQAVTPDEDEPTPVADAALDAAGKKIPEHLQEVFKRRYLFNNIMTISRKMNGALKELVKEEHDEATCQMNKSQAQNDLKNFLQQIKYAIPHAVCPYCKGKGHAKGGGCQPCRGLGWLVKSCYNSIPDDER